MRPLRRARTLRTRHSHLTAARGSQSSAFATLFARVRGVKPTQEDGFPLTSEDLAKTERSGVWFRFALYLGAMKAFPHSLGFVIVSLLSGVVFAGCGGGGSSFTASPTPIPTSTPAPGDHPYTQATFNVSVTQSANSNYNGTQFKNKGTGRFFDFTSSLGIFYIFTCRLPPTNIPGKSKLTDVYISLESALEEGKVFPINPSAKEVSVGITVNPGGTGWDDAIQGSGGKITITKLSPTSVTLKVENVALPARPAVPGVPGLIAAAGTLTLNGTITAQLPQ